MGESVVYYCRRFQKGDLENVMHWRISPDVTQFMNAESMLTLDGQKRWFEKLSSAGEVYCWLFVQMVFLVALQILSILIWGWGYYIAEKD